MEKPFIFHILYHYKEMGTTQMNGEMKVPHRPCARRIKLSENGKNYTDKNNIN